MLSPGLNIMFGVQSGGEGKGKVAAWLADSGLVDIACCDFSPAVSYSAQFSNSEQFAVSQIPMAAAVCSYRGAPLPHLAILLPTAVIHIPTLLAEVDHYGIADRLLIDSRCAVIEPQHEAGDVVGMAENNHERWRFASRAALADVAGGAVNLAGNHSELDQWITSDVTRMVRTLAGEGKRVLVEMGNGFDQSLHFGDHKVTALDTTVGAALNAAGCPPALLAEVIAVVKATDGDVETLGRLLQRCWRINRPSQAVVNFCDQLPHVGHFVSDTQLGIATGALWTSDSVSPESIQRW